MLTTTAKYIGSRRFWLALAGTVLYVLAINLFIVPHGLYTGGLMGASQLIRSVILMLTHTSSGSFDFAGIILYIINVPIFVLAFRRLGKQFVFTSLLWATVMTILMSVIPIPSAPILGEDVLASSLIGGFGAGTGIGLLLRASTSVGGLDVVGLMMIQKNPQASVGRINIIVNIAVYAVCLIIFDLPTVVYSLLAAIVAGIAIDRTHTQNINVEVHVITSSFSGEMKDRIMKTMTRGITVIPAKGAYTEKQSEILYMLVSKYELHQLKEIIHTYDPNAFIVTKEGVSVTGNFLKKLVE